MANQSAIFLSLGGWELQQINFVVGNRRSVVGNLTKFKTLDVQEGKIDKHFRVADHVTQLCEAHNRGILSFLQQVQGLARPTTKGSRENILHNMHV